MSKTTNIEHRRLAEFIVESCKDIDASLPTLLQMFEQSPEFVGLTKQMTSAEIPMMFLAQEIHERKRQIRLAETRLEELKAKLVLEEERMKLYEELRNKLVEKFTDLKSNDGEIAHAV
jgi:hypothetical protein